MWVDEGCWDCGGGGGLFGGRGTLPLCQLGRYGDEFFSSLKIKLGQNPQTLFDRLVSKVDLFYKIIELLSLQNITVSYS